VVILNLPGLLMPQFSEKSLARLKTCHVDLQRLFNAVVEHFDCTVLCGHRGRAEQNDSYRRGRSRLKYPHSRHNKKPSLAVDVAPYPLDWEDRERFCLFAGYVLGVADSMGISIRWGGDWNKNMLVGDNRFDDLPHFELDTP
jgi:peptidoglycan L-alanyl-D-glutamate endopeptidase CwlK